MQDRLEAFYDALWANETSSLNRHERDRIATVLGLVRQFDLPNARILDAGCGVGKLAARLAQFGEVTAVDWSERGVEAGRRHAAGVCFRRLDLVRGDIRPYVGRFGLTVSSEVLEHVGRAHRRPFLMRLASTLTPGGILVLTTPNRDRVEALAELGALFQPEEDLLSPPETLALVEEAGLTVFATRSTTFLEGVWERSAAFRKLRSFLPRPVEGLDFVDRILCHSRLGFYFVVCARKPLDSVGDPPGR